jgi:hypothetical protein
MDSWSNKPLYFPESTTPVAARKVSKFERMRMSDVVIPPNFFLAYAVALLGPLIMWYHPCKKKQKEKNGQSFIFIELLIS